MPEDGALRRLRRRFVTLGGGAYAVVERDFLVLTSTKRFLAVRLGVALVAALAVAAIAITQHGDPPDGIGRSVLGTAVVVVPMLVLLIAPAAAAPAITAERDGGTLDLVLAAPVSAGTFVLAKFVARLLAIAVLIFAMLPVAAVCLLYGGVPFTSFLALATFSVATAAFCVATGLLFSSYLNSVAAAVLGAFLFVLLAPPIPLLIAALLDERGLPISDGNLESLATGVPFYVWTLLGNTAFRGEHPPEECWTYAAIMVVVTALLLARAAVRMRREGNVTAKRSRRRAARGLFLGRPLLDRSVRGSLLWHPGRRGFVVPALAVLGEILLLWVAAAEHDLDEEWVHLAALGSLTLLATLQVLTATASSLATERKRGSLDLLHAAPFRASQLVQGVLAGALLSASPLLALGALHGTLAAACGVLHPLAVLTWGIATAVTVSLVAAIGVRATVSARSPTQAALWAFGAFFGANVLAVLLVILMALGSVDGDVVGALLFSLPPLLVFCLPFAAHQAMTESLSRVDDVYTIAPALALLVYLAVAVVLVVLAERALAAARD